MSLNEAPLMKATTTGIAVHQFAANLYKRYRKKRKIFRLLGQ